MDGLEKVRKKDFIKIFMGKYPETNSKELEKDLTTINKERNIVLYHNQGFLFELRNLHTKDKSVMFGDYVSSFNINAPHNMITTGGNYAYSAHGNYPHAIHPNIYVKHTLLRLPTVRDNQVIQLCFNERQKPLIDELTKKGLLYSAFDMVNHIFSNTERYDGLWHGFKFPGGCDICEDQTLERVYKNGIVFRCKKCQDAMNPNPVNEVVHEDEEDEEEEDNEPF